MSVLERCPSYKESNKGNKQRQGPTLGARFTEVSVKKESTVVQFTPVLRNLHSLLVQSGITYKILFLAFYPLIPESDQDQISPCNINMLCKTEWS